jgi:hypothetical protein
MGSDCNALICCRGDGPTHVALDAVTHGQEYATALALVDLAKENWEVRWPNLRGMLTWSDLDGLAREGYGFVSVSGKEAPNLPMAGSRWNRRDYWVSYDRNSLWGSVNDDSLPASHRQHRFSLGVFEPRFTIAMHETVDEPGDAYYVGEGLLLIEEFPLSGDELRAMQGFGSLAPLASWAASMVKLPPYLKAGMALKHNPAFALLAQAAKDYAKGGGRLISDFYLDFLRGFTPLGKGRIMHSRGLIDAPWLTFTGYNLARYGAPGVTLESFNAGYVGLRGIEERAASQVGYITSLLDLLNAQGI